MERIQEALAIYRSLRPDRYEGNVATCLNNFANRLSELGRFNEALGRTREALVLYERLAAARPDRYEADLAMSLSNLGGHLRELGHFDEALSNHPKPANGYQLKTGQR